MGQAGTFKAGIGVRTLKQEIVPVPETVAHLRAKALVDGALHATLHRGTERLPPFAQQLRLQVVLPLTDHRAGGGPRFNSDAPVGCQPVFLTAGKNRTDTAGEAAHRQRNCRDGKHQTALLRPIPKALSPKVLAWKGAASVCFNIPSTVGEIQALAVQFQCSIQGMAHTDDAMKALHPGKETERPHDVGLEDSKGAVAQGPTEGKAVLLDMEVDPLTAETGLPDLHLKGPPGDLKL